MSKFSNWQELRQLFLLSFPIIIAQIARTAMGVVDIVMSGHYATADLAAVTLGSSIWFPIFVLGYGTIIMLAADVAKHKAQGNEEGVKESLRNYLFLSMILSIPIILLLMLISELFSFIGLDDDILAITRGYVLAMAFSVPGVMIFNVFSFIFARLRRHESRYVSIFWCLITEYTVKLHAYLREIWFARNGRYWCGYYNGNY